MVLKDRNRNPSLALVGPNTVFTEKIIGGFNGCHRFGDLIQRTFSSQ